MQLKIIEATNGPLNWGKFMVTRFDTEFGIPSIVGKSSSLLRSRGWSRTDIIVFDLETCEGAAFHPGGSARNDLNKHKIWVCPLFEPFLTWLYKQDLNDLNTLPAHVDLPKAPFAMQGYRRTGT